MENTTIGKPMLASIWTTLRKFDAKYRDFVENAVLGIFQATVTGQYIKANQALADIYGYDSPERLMAQLQNIGEQLYVQPSRHEELLKLLGEEKAVARFESQVYRRDRQIIVISETVRAIYDGNGNLTGYEGTIEDITERHLSEIALQAALQTAMEKEKTKGSLDSYSVSMICHELRSPLTTILLSTNLLGINSPLIGEADKLKYLDRIRAAVKSMNDLVEGFLVIGKADAGRVELQKVPLDMQKFCQELWQEVQLVTSSEHSFDFACNCGTVYLLTDMTLLRQIFTNLLLNAVKYSPQGEKIHLQIHCQANQMSLRVQDEGIGIPPENLSGLFEPFYRADNTGKIAGTGLGLAIVKKAVEIHQGEILVESELGVGTTFIVKLPIISNS